MTKRELTGHIGGVAKGFPESWEALFRKTKPLLECSLMKFWNALKERGFVFDDIVMDAYVELLCDECHALKWFVTKGHIRYSTFIDRFMRNICLDLIGQFPPTVSIDEIDEQWAERLPWWGWNPVEFKRMRCKYKQAS
jgi:hypothetical protein